MHRLSYSDLFADASTCASSSPDAEDGDLDDAVVCSPTAKSLMESVVDNVVNDTITPETTEIAPPTTEWKPFKTKVIDVNMDNVDPNPNPTSL